MRMTRFRHFIGVLGLLLGVAVSVPAASVAETPEFGYALAHELMSPFCPGRTLAACTSPQAAQLRQEILLMEASGAAREEVIANLVSRFGEVIKPAPKKEGWGLAAHWLPGVAMLGGALLVVVVLLRITRFAPQSGERVAEPGEAVRAAAPDSDSDLEAAMEAELRAAREA